MGVIAILQQQPSGLRIKDIQALFIQIDFERSRFSLARP